jgi:hypothetical protein
VGIGKSGAGHRLDSQVVEAVGAGFQTGNPVPQTDPSRKLHGNKVDHLAPPGERTRFPTSTVFGFQLGQMRSRNKFKHLRKDCVTIGHGLKSLFCLIGYAKPF